MDNKHNTQENFYEMLGGNKCRIKAEYGIQKQRESQCKIRWTEQALLRNCSLERDLKQVRGSAWWTSGEEYSRQRAQLGQRLKTENGPGTLVQQGSQCWRSRRGGGKM